MKKSITILLMLLIAMGTTSMAEVPMQKSLLGHQTTFTTIGNAIAPDYALFKKFYFNETQVEAQAGQEMIVHITSIENRAIFQIETPLGKMLDGASKAENAQYWHGILPVSGEYNIVVRATQGHTEFKLKITIQDVPYHTVSQGESLPQIAKTYGYQVSEMALWNNLALPYQLQKGQKIRISAPITHRIPSQTHHNVLSNTPAIEKTKPSESQKIEHPLLENSLTKLLKEIRPVPKRTEMAISTSEVNFAKMLETMTQPTQPKKKMDGNVAKENTVSQTNSQTNFIKMLDAIPVPPKKTDNISESEAAENSEKSSTVEISIPSSQHEDTIATQVKQPNIHPKNSETELTTANNQRSWTYKYMIHPTVPELTFKLSGRLLENTQYVEVMTIEIYQHDEAIPFQILQNLNIQASVHDNALSFKLKDINLDGYQDIILVTTLAPNGSRLYTCWIFDPIAKIFVKLILDCGW